ncbi:Methyltransferase type 11 [Methylobacterium sp. 4-46]|uniref:methyltransferase domain-containing protein n=1 Tax=unclassified Methylobacterium TaxID=2615210 RepID=UPI000152D2FA|nr:MULTISPECIES: methyltransferase domain-containing protein [Methylobacterium]ACA18025.1 Methyltransferase type 11 [Methylobacterium sp. 4-46]WFT77326.1 methyltransferase domain-containing protein [Methylobacterium nodulans]
MGRALDTFTIARGIVIASGWTTGRRPRILYDGRPLASAFQAIERPDVVAAFGKRAARWGFRLAAVTTLPEPDPERVAIRFGFRDVVPLTAYADRNRGRLLPKFVDLVAERGGSLLEIGARARSGHVYRTLFPASVAYTGMDILAGPNVDVVGDAHHLSRVLDRRFDFAFSVSVFEHLLMPWKAALELNRVLTDGGLAYIGSHQAWPLHEAPWDFWRFSDNAWRGLFNRHTGFEVVETEMGLEGFTVPSFSGAGPIAGIDRQPAFLSSSCLVRKVAPPAVSWDAEVAEIYDLHYSHA